ncbi:MAG: Gfo/Idh/MocA family oxidoreductase, partial [Acidobacteria bacterium]|nr:Gfo/Idh/MocA family oxidoreductase [Acidobacteriota bacterium]
MVSWDRNESARFLDPDSTIPEIDAVAICSPAETHLDYLAAALARGLHVFCEKPIVWPREDSRCAGPVLLNVLAEALDVARRNSLVVHENTQWVYTLEDFRRIAGAFAPNEIAQFRCELSPSGGTAAGMIMECSTHANSLLLELGCRGVEEPLVRFEAGGAGRPATLDIRFRSRRPSGAPVEVEYQFARQAGQPRHAAYEVN